MPPTGEPPGRSQPGARPPVPPRSSEGGATWGAVAPAPIQRSRRRWWLLAVVPAFVGLAGAATAVLLARDDGASDADPALTPQETTAAFYDALREGDCVTVEAMRTDALRQEIQARAEENRGFECALLAERLAAEPDLAPKVVDIQVVFREDDLIIVDVTFRQRDGQHRASRNHLIRQSDGTWKFGILTESAQVELEDIPPELRPQA